jgi:hypothetical protein
VARRSRSVWCGRFGYGSVWRVLARRSWSGSPGRREARHGRYGTGWYGRARRGAEWRGRVRRGGRGQVSAWKAGSGRVTRGGRDSPLRCGARNCAACAGIARLDMQRRSWFAAGREAARRGRRGLGVAVGGASQVGQGTAEPGGARVGVAVEIWVAPRGLAWPVRAWCDPASYDATRHGNGKDHEVNS